MKRIIAALLVLALCVSAGPAFALTGAEALGLVDENTVYDGYPTLFLGSRDGADSAAYVVALQNRLRELGYLSSAADGQYGRQTEAAVLRFQEENGLTPSGVADDSTQSYLFSNDAKKAPASEIVDSEPLRVQQKLMLWGFLYGIADGDYGDATQTAVAEFKNYLYEVCPYDYSIYATPSPKATLSPDGQQPVAVDVVRTVDSAIEVNGYDGSLTEDVRRFVNGEYEFKLFQRTVKSGDKGDEVLRVQRRLRHLGYLYNPDGEFGSLTERALRYFQKKNGLPETGIADEATQEKLFSVSAMMSDEYIFPYKIGVSIEDQRVYVYAWDGSGYNEQVHRFKCSTGVNGSDTPTGTYQAGGRVTMDEWYYFEQYDCYAKYAFRIVGGILFHSVLFNSRKQGPTSGSVNNLGRKASHGCVRLAVDDARWIFENCPVGTTVVIR